MTTTPRESLSRSIVKHTCFLLLTCKILYTTLCLQTFYPNTVIYLLRFPFTKLCMKRLSFKSAFVIYAGVFFFLLLAFCRWNGFRQNCVIFLRVQPGTLYNKKVFFVENEVLSAPRNSYIPKYSEKENIVMLNLLC